MEETREQFLERRLESMTRGAAEAIAMERERRRRLGLPMWVSRDGRVFDENAGGAAKTRSADDEGR